MIRLLKKILTQDRFFSKLQKALNDCDIFPDTLYYLGLKDIPPQEDNFKTGWELKDLIYYAKKMKMDNKFISESLLKIAEKF